MAFGRMGARGWFGSLGLLGGAKGPQIQLSNSLFVAASTQGTAIGTLSVTGGTGTYTFTLNDSASNKVQVAGTNGVNLQTGSSSASASSFSISVHADNGAGSIINQTFLITAGALVSPPAAFAVRWTPSFSIYQYLTTNFTTFDIASVKPSIDVQYYIDPVNGVDANDGLTRATAKKSLSPLLLLAASGTVRGVRIINMTSDVTARGSFGWNGSVPTMNLVIEVEGSYRFISAGTSTTSALTFTKTAGQTNVYQTAYASSAASVADVSSKTSLTHPTTGANLNVPPAYYTHNKVASIAAVETLGTYFLDTTNHILYVSTFNGRAPDNSIIVSSTFTNGRMGTANGLTLWVRGIDFVNGTTAFTAATISAANTSTLAFSNCSFQSTNSGNGLSLTGLITNYNYRSGAYYNFADGFNYHSFNSDGVTSGTSPFVFENECVAIGNGTTGSVPASNNASTAHDFATLVRLNCTYLNSYAVLVGEINSTMSWNLGTYAGQAIASYSDVGVDNSGMMWWDGGTFASGVNPQVNLPSLTTFFGYRNMPAPATVSGIGTVTAY